MKRQQSERSTPNQVLPEPLESQLAPSNQVEIDSLSPAPLRTGLPPTLSAVPADPSPSEAFDWAMEEGQGPLPYQDQLRPSFGDTVDDVTAFFGRGAPLHFLEANAITNGDVIVFAEEKPSARTVAHELAHLVQGVGGSGGSVSQAGDAHEQEAEELADAALKGEEVSPEQSSGADLHREEGTPEPERHMLPLAAQDRESNPDRASSHAFETLRTEDINTFGLAESATGAVGDLTALIAATQKLGNQYGITDDDQEVLNSARITATIFGRAVPAAVGETPDTTPREDLYETYQDNTLYEYEELGQHRRRLTDAGRAARSKARAAWEEERKSVAARIREVRGLLVDLLLAIDQFKEGLRPTVEAVAEGASEALIADLQAISHVDDAALTASSHEELSADDNAAADAIEAMNRQLDGRKLNADHFAQAGGTLTEIAARTANRAQVARALLALKNLPAELDALLVSADDAITKEGGSHYLRSKAWSTFTNDILGTMDQGHAIRLRHMPQQTLASMDMASGATFFSDIQLLLERATQKIDKQVVLAAPKAAAGTQLARLVKVLHEREEEHAHAMIAALPALKEAVLHSLTRTKLEKRSAAAGQLLLAYTEEGKIGLGAEAFKAQILEVEALHEQTLDQDAPRWFTFLSHIHPLVAGVTELNGFSAADIASAKMSLDFAGMLREYGNWFDLIDAARAKILEDNDVARMKASLAHLDAFEKSTRADMASASEKLLGGVEPQSIIDRIDLIKGDLEVVLGAPSTKDAMESFETKYAPKLAFDVAWKGIVGEEGWRKGIGTFQEGLSKGAQGMSMLVNASKLLDGGDAVSLAGGTHPAVDALAAGLDAVNMFNKVPVFGTLIDFYVVALGAISKGMAVISKQAAEKRLALAGLQGVLDGPVMR